VGIETFELLEEIRRQTRRLVAIEDGEIKIIS
jgi:hypothetical protein